MSTDYKTITDRLVAILNAERTDKLSENVSGTVVAVNKGQYTQGDTSRKPIVYVRLRASGLVWNIAGGLERDERLKCIISGATSGETQEAAWDDAECLANNCMHVLENYQQDTGYWGAGGLGWDYPREDESGDDFFEIGADPGQSVVTVHFQVMWSCNIRIARESL